MPNLDYTTEYVQESAVHHLETLKQIFTDLIPEADEEMKDQFKTRIDILNIELKEFAEPMNAILLMHKLDEITRQHLFFQRDVLQEGPLTDKKEYAYEDLDEQFSYLRTCLSDLTDSLVHYDVEVMKPDFIHKDSWSATDLAAAFKDLFEVDIEKLSEANSTNFGIPGDRPIVETEFEYGGARIEFEGGLTATVKLSEDQNPILY